MFNFFSKKLNFISIGAGGMAEKHTKEFIKLGHNLIGVHSPNKIKKKFFLQFNYFASIEEIYNLNYDFLIICSPNIFHSEQIKLFITKHKPIFIEKPIVTNLKKLDLDKKDIFAKLIFVSFNLRYQKNTTELKKIIQKNKSKIKKIKINWKRNQNLENNKWNYKKEISGGGILLYLGIYCLDLVNYILKIKNYKICEINFLDIRSQIEFMFNGKFFLDEYETVLNLSWLAEKQEEPLNIRFELNDNSQIIWRKNGKITLKKESFEKILFKSNQSSVHKYFLEEYCLKNKLKINDEKIDNFNIYKLTQKIIDESYSLFP